MNQQQLDEIKARAQAALPDDNPPNMDKVKAMALFRQHAANDVLALVAEVERLRAEVSSLENKEMNAYLDRELENERLRAACQLVLDECQDVLYTARLEAVTREIKKALGEE